MGYFASRGITLMVGIIIDMIYQMSRLAMALLKRF